MRNLRAIGLVVLAWLTTVYASGCYAGLQSPDKKYEAVTVRTDTGIHYQVKKTDGGDVVLTTRAQYTSFNDVKCGRFSADSTMFAGAYHYGHAGNYTFVWVGSLADGKFVRSVRLEGWVKSIPASVFKKNE